jgi:hypothetical protein
MTPISMRALAEYRRVVTLAASAIAGTIALHPYPFPADNLILSLVRLERPLVYAAPTYTYSALWITTPFVVASLGVSSLFIFAARWDRLPSGLPLPAYPALELRQDLFLVLGERHHRTNARTRPGTIVAHDPRTRPLHRHARRRRHRFGQDVSVYAAVRRPIARLSSRRRGAQGSGLGARSEGGFCRQVREILERQGRAGDYVEVGLDSTYRYNPLPNDLDAYALAFGIATLITNLYGRGKEPFWQQAR